MIICLLLIIVYFQSVKSDFQWLSDTDLANNVTIAACYGQDVTLAWNYNVTSDVHVIDAQWLFQKRGKFLLTIFFTIVTI